MPASRERNLVIKSDFQCPLLHRIPIGKIVKRDDLLYQFLSDHKLDELGATDQALVILAGIKFCQVIDGHIKGVHVSELAKEEKDFVGMANVLRPKTTSGSEDSKMEQELQSMFGNDSNETD